MSANSLTRRELYDLVWTKPITKLASEFGISDVGLLKVCQRHRVPTPPRGYWAKVEAGKPAKKALFVEVPENDLDTIHISGMMAQLPEPVREIVQAARDRRQRESRQRQTVTIATAVEPIVDVHKVVSATARALRRAKPDKVIHAIGEGLCGVTISASSAERAIAILDSLARGLEAVGISLTATGKGMCCATGPDSVEFVLNERTRREKHVPTDAERIAEERRLKRREAALKTSSWNYVSYSYERAYPEFDTVYTGELVVQVDGWDGGLRRKWSDGRVQRLETLLDGIVSGIQALLTKRKCVREEREEWSRQYQERQRRQQLAQARKEREQRRQCFLSLLFERQQQLKGLHGLLACLGTTNSDAVHSDLDRFVSWARLEVVGLEKRLSPPAVDEELQALKLFPEVDDLRDSTGYQ